MFWENAFEVPRKMPESIIPGSCEHNPRTPSQGIFTKTEGECGKGFREKVWRVAVGCD